MLKAVNACCGRNEEEEEWRPLMLYQGSAEVAAAKPRAATRAALSVNEVIAKRAGGSPRTD